MPDDPRRASSVHAEWMKQWEQSVSKWWDSAIEDPAFTASMGDALAGRAKVTALQAAAAERTLDQMQLPSRKDMVRLTKIASMLEDRLVALEDRLESLTEHLARMEKENLRARIDMTEALLRIEARLAASDGAPAAPAAAPKGPSPSRRKRSE